MTVSEANRDALQDPVQVRLRLSQFEQIQAAARERGIQASAVIRELVARGLTAHATKADLSDRAQRLDVERRDHVGVALKHGLDLVDETLRLVYSNDPVAARKLHRAVIESVRGWDPEAGQ